jgi:L-iditol 2-dehydrogenase
VLVTGAGPVGLLVTQVARALGATQIVVSDIDARRLERATASGATDVVDAREPLPQGLSVDAFVDCSGVTAAVTAGVPRVRPRGAVVLVGMGADEVALPVPVIQNRELVVTGTFRYANTWPQAISLAARGEVDLDSLVTAHVDLDHVVDALAPDPGAGHVKIMVRPGGV